MHTGRGEDILLGLALQDISNLYGVQSIRFLSLDGQACNHAMDLLQHDAQKVRQPRPAILQECYSVVSPTNPPEFAGTACGYYLQLITM